MDNTIFQKTLICFTASYPYGKRETYFENELEFLSQNFKKVIILPTYNPYGKIKRSVPANVQVENVVLKQGIHRGVDFIKNFRVSPLLIKEFFVFKVYLSSVRLKKWLLSLLSYGKGYNAFKKQNFDPKEVVLYSYWTGQNFFTKKELGPFKKIIRMHGGDFYLERNDGYIPLQNEIYKSANLLLPISKHIYKKLIGCYRISKDNVKLSYLGTNNQQNKCSLKSNNKLNLISCSNVYPLKRIHLIYEILKGMNQQISIEWTHIGSGELLDDLKEQIKNDKKENICVNFLGQKTQSELNEIYKDNYFDFFMNTSEYEGLPVSIMEAFSFGIPAIATDVGGTSEIVNHKNGLLIKKDFDVSLVAKKIESLYFGKKYQREKAFETWNKYFNASKNYQKLIKDASKLW